MSPPLPIEDVLPELLAALATCPNAVLAAPPGAGKTTRVPLALLGAGWLGDRRILMLEPRRIAARAAAERLAEQLGENVGHSVGLRIRGETRTAPDARIEVVTEGVLTRMLQSQPDLPDIGAVLFDEVHERSIHSDLGLALSLDAQGALRPDLRLVAMSATLETGRFAALMGDAPVIESPGRAHPVETRWLDRPWRRQDQPRGAFEAATARLVRRAVDEAAGDVLVFLPGAGEINRVRAALTDLAGVECLALYGALPFERQRAILVPGPRRRVILATAIAETSLTVPGVGVVVDAGRARRARVDPATGLSRLVTVPVSRAEADQRRGRAGRLGPGVCYRMWTSGEEGALPAFAPPGIAEADLTALALELAQWGEADPARLPFLDPPPPRAYAAARTLLQELGALDPAGRITAHGTRLAEMPTHPRLAQMLARARDEDAGPLAGLIAALLGERDPMRGQGAGSDVNARIEALVTRSPAIGRGAAGRIRAEAARLGGNAAGVPAPCAAGGIAQHAYPDRIAVRRPGEAPRYLLTGGRGARLAPGDPLAGERLLVALDLEDGREAEIRLAAPLDEAALRDAYGARISEVAVAEWSPTRREVVARRREMLGGAALTDRAWPLRDVPGEMIGRALIAGLRAAGAGALPWSGPAAGFRHRVAWARASGAGSLPDLSDDALMATLEDWLLPHLDRRRRLEELGGLNLRWILERQIGHAGREALDRAAPAHFTTPRGSVLAIDYSGDAPGIRVAVQELFGIDRHPQAAGVPLRVTLLSPAGRPVQTTGDLPGFWTTSYGDVRKEMRARYPRHSWPEDPLSATPTRRPDRRRR